MVSSSRKKNKGRERKAKKAEAERAEIAKNRKLWWGLSIGEKELIGKTITCNHGHGTIHLSLDHPVSRFMNDFISQ